MCRITQDTVNYMSSEAGVIDVIRREYASRTATAAIT